MCLVAADWAKRPVENCYYRAPLAMSEHDEELAAQHLLGLKELGKALAAALPKELEDAICTPLGIEQKRTLLKPLDGTPEQCVTCP